MKIGIAVASATVLFALISCSTFQPRPGEFVYLHDRGAWLPVWIEGNTDSHVYVVVINGGPGITALDGAYYLSHYESLRQKYGVVFWDQRSFGMAWDTGELDAITVADHVSDLDMVVDYVGATDPEAQIFLLGVSWGGFVGTQYLLDPGRQAKITGWIEQSGAHDTITCLAYGRAFIRAYAESVLVDANADERDRKYWAEAIRFVADNAGNTSPEYRTTHFDYVARAYGYFTYWPSRAFPPPVIQQVGLYRMFFHTPSNYVQCYMVNYAAGNERLENFWDRSVLPEMDAIMLPTLIIHGECDGATPVQMARDAYEVIGTPEEKKRLVILPDAAHCCAMQQPELFVEAVVEFIEANRVVREDG
jgi:proline iminopeptidase